MVPSPRAETPDAAKARRAKRLTRQPRMRLAGERPSWSDLLQRVFRVDGFACPGCGGPLTLRCVGCSGAGSDLDHATALWRDTSSSSAIASMRTPASRRAVT